MAVKSSLETQQQPASVAKTGTGDATATKGGLRRGFKALEVRNYRLFWIGQLISLTGTWMQTTAQSWLVLQLTHSPLALGLVTALQFLPIMVLSLFGGVLIDRYSKQRILLATQSLALLQATIFGTLVALGMIQLWHVYVLAAFQGTINAIDNPTRQAFVPELSGRQYLTNAVALNSMLFNASRIVGPAAAGLMIGRYGIAPTLYVNAVSFVAVIAVLLMMDQGALFASRGQPDGPMLGRLVEGLAYVWGTPQVLMIMIVVASIGTFGYNFSVVLPLLAGFVLHTNATGFGGLSAFLGLGSLLAALVVAYARKITVQRLLLGSGMFSVLLAGVAFSTNFAVSAVLLVALGFAGITFATTANSLLQLTVPDELRGRVMSLYILLFAGTTPIGGLLIGTLAHVIGVSWTLLVSATLCLCGVLLATAYRWRSA
ncbi:MAG: MFS transporter [Herpetosiphon sp.]